MVSQIPIKMNGLKAEGGKFMLLCARGLIVILPGKIDDC